MNNKILVLGATGFLGVRLVKSLKNSGYTVITHGRVHGDYRMSLNIYDQVKKLLDEVNPDLILSLVGITNVDLCEREPNQAYLNNVQPIENISKWISLKSRYCHLIYISTDQVYDGLGPHIEANVTLTNYYAFSKYAGEMAALRVGGTVLRTNFFGKGDVDNNKGLTDWLYSALLRRESISVFEDIKFSPISIASLVKIIEIFVQKKCGGIFNIGSREGLTKADFAYAFAKELNFSSSSMKRVNFDEINSFDAYRPKDMRMNCMKFEKLMGAYQPRLIEEITKVAKEYL